jgi:hypothetical protein
MVTMYALQPGSTITILLIGGINVFLYMVEDSKIRGLHVMMADR